MNRNRIASAALGILMLLGLAIVPALAEGKNQTLTGEVSDSMCGVKHEMPGKAADCTRACVKHGANYSLVVGDKVYKISADSQAKVMDHLGDKVKVEGTLSGDTITITSVS